MDLKLKNKRNMAQNMSKEEFQALIYTQTRRFFEVYSEDTWSQKAKSANYILATSIKSSVSEKWEEITTISFRSLLTFHSSGIITTVVTAVKNNTGNTRELYKLPDTGYSSALLSNNYYLKNMKNMKKSQCYYSKGPI